MTETIKSAKELCRYYMSVGIPVYIHGPPGVGKSELWAQIAQEQKIGLIDLRLGMMDPVDLLGLQAIINGKTIWNRPGYWPDAERDGERGILLFDEMSDCSRAMQSAAYQLVLNGRAGPHILPPGWYRCAAGNRREDKAAAQTLSTALANRFAHVDVVADKDAFIEWADKNDIHPYVNGFIRTRPALLHSMDGADLRAFPTPRAWARASRCVDAPPDMRYRLLRGIVGDGAAAEFEGFLTLAIDLPDLEEITKDPKKCRIPKEPSAKYALSSMLARAATRANFEKILTYISRPEFGRDFEIVTALDASRRDGSLCETKEWITFANRNSDLVL